MIFVPGGIPGPAIVWPTANGNAPGEGSAAPGVEEVAFCDIWIWLPNSLNPAIVVPGGMPGPAIGCPTTNWPESADQLLMNWEPFETFPVPVAVRSEVIVGDPEAVVPVAVPPVG